MNFLERKTKKGDKIVFYYDFGRGKGQRPTTGIFIYTRLLLSFIFHVLHLLYESVKTDRLDLFVPLCTTQYYRCLSRL